MHNFVPAHPTATSITTTTITPWIDPIVDQRGHDPRSDYVERYWLSVIGPTATWIMRRFAVAFDTSPDGFRIDLAHTASTMGLSYAKGHNSPFGKALHRCVMFGLARPSADGFAVRRRVPSVARRHLERLPTDVQAQHDEWARRIVQIDRRDIERRLVDAGVAPTLAVRASELLALTG
jgi:hypothetical protein